MPPASLIALSPSVPSVPLPERMTPMAPACLSSASEWKNASIGPRRSSGVVALTTSKTPPCSRTIEWAGAT